MTVVVSGRCYCGKIRITATAPPVAVTYCHCDDCRRVTSAPVAAFAAFDIASIAFTPDEGKSISKAPGVVRTFCDACGSTIAGHYDYLPDQVYVGLGLLDQADDFAPQLHAHYENRMAWLDIQDDLPKSTGSARCQLNDKSQKPED
ncbi:MAG: GFA family protein [Pseudomonadota bacterium]